MKLSDLAEFTTNCVFYPNLTPRVDSLRTPFAVIEVNQYDIVAGKYLAIKAFTHRKTIEEDVGGPTPLGREFFQKLTTQNPFLRTQASCKDKVSKVETEIRQENTPDGAANDPVSYTHLTLPTNREV